MIILEKIKYKIRQYWQAYVLKDEAAILALLWLKNDKIYDYRHRNNLFENAIIFDCGGFKGEFTKKMVEMYPKSNIYVFEVVPKYIEILERLFKNNSKVKIFPFGLGIKDENLQFSIDDVASTIFFKNKEDIENTVIGEIKNVNDFIVEHKIDRIDLLKMNIEGGEYDLLDALIQSGNIKKCSDIPIQFHNYGLWSVERRDKIKAKLIETHYLTYDYEWNFENWHISTPQKTEKTSN
jgi:FkbM family methyltransferase